MTLLEALDAVFRDGERIHRSSWASSNDVFITLHSGQLSIWGVPADGVFHPWTITETDFFARDWEILADDRD